MFSCTTTETRASPIIVLERKRASARIMPDAAPVTFEITNVSVRFGSFASVIVRLVECGCGRRRTALANFEMEPAIFETDPVNFETASAELEVAAADTKLESARSDVGSARFRMPPAIFQLEAVRSKVNAARMKHEAAKLEVERA